MAGVPKVLASRRLRETWPPISEDDVELPSGHRKQWVRLQFGDSAAILPLTKDREVVLTREYRHGLGRVAIALPGGICENGETPEACAHRELMEETGLKAGRLLHLYSGNSLTSYLEGTLHIFFAGDCAWTGQAPDPDEVQALEKLTPTRALDLARRGEFESTIVALAILLADARGWLIS
jgi:ADP-ribose pyrophosphatase